MIRKFFNYLIKILFFISIFLLVVIFISIFIIFLGINLKSEGAICFAMNKFNFSLKGSFIEVFSKLCLLDLSFFSALINSILAFYNRNEKGSLFSSIFYWILFLFFCIISYLFGVSNFSMLVRFLLFIFKYFFSR